jgi:cellulose synthase/poly-beta-1,6-N-acetylglucosamine synthase-like glycosyltransferase
MAFPWRVISQCPLLGANLVEDLAMGIELAVLGYPAQTDPEIRVLSSLPEDYDSAMRQRRRWEHGHLDMLRLHFLRLIKESIAQKRVDLLALALDLAVPPLALLVLLETAMLIAAAALFGATGSGVPLLAASFATACTLLALGVAWVVFGRGVLAVRQVLLVPVYLLQKMPVYLSYFLRRKQRVWERTRRDDEQDVP